MGRRVAGSWREPGKEGERKMEREDWKEGEREMGREV